jgi:transcriptional regulator with XRE-family HTH domain
MPKGPNTAPGTLTRAVAELLRVEKGRLMLNDSQISVLSGVDRIAVGLILRGLKVPDLELLNKLCLTLGTTVSSVTAAAYQNSAD